MKYPFPRRWPLHPTPGSSYDQDTARIQNNSPEIQLMEQLNAVYESHPSWTSLITLILFKKIPYFYITTHIVDLYHKHFLSRPQWFGAKSTTDILQSLITEIMSFVEKDAHVFVRVRICDYLITVQMLYPLIDYLTATDFVIFY